MPSTRKSPVWQYFTKTPKGSLCSLCKKEVINKGGNTSNLASHLRRVHNVEVLPLPIVNAGISPRTVREKPADQSSLSSERTQHAAQMTLITQKPGSTESAGSSSSTILNPVFERARMAGLPSSRVHQLTRAVTYYLVGGMLPYSTIDNTHFRNLVHTLEPRYKIPSRSTFREQIVPAWYKEEKTILMKELQNSECVSLTTDSWTSCATESYNTITCHYIQNFTLKSKVLQTEKMLGAHTGENIALELDAALSAWGLDGKIMAVTVDNAANIGKACKLSKYVELKVPCFAHTLALAARRTEDCSSTCTFTKFIRSAVAYFHRSTSATCVLDEMQDKLGLQKHKLIMDVTTRWNSTYLMLDRYMEQRLAVSAALNAMKDTNGKNLRSTLDDFSVRKCEDYICHMKHLYDATQLMSSETCPTVSLILPLQAKLLEKFSPNEEDNEFVKKLKRAVFSNLCNRYQDDTLRNFLEEASALDPRTKKKSCVSECVWERIEDKLVEMMSVEDQPHPENTMAVPTTDGLCDEPPAKKSLLDDSDEETDELENTCLRSRAKDEIRMYRQSPKISPASDPMQFWKELNASFPTIRELALRYSCVQATSVSSERIFSVAGDIVTAERSRLHHEQVDVLIFLKKNLEL